MARVSSRRSPEANIWSFCRFLANLSLFLIRCHLVGTLPANLSHVVDPAGDVVAVMEAEVRFMAADGWVSSTLGKVEAAAVVAGQPARSFPTYKGQRNYPGLLWTATTGSLVGYESLLERDRLWLADFDPAVRAICGQPFWLTGRDGFTLRRHVPDFLLQLDDGSYLVVDVKPAALLAEPTVVEVLSWTGRLCAGKGWGYQVWSGADPTMLRNIRFLGGGRRPQFVDEDAVVKVDAAAGSGMTIAEVEQAAEVDRSDARAAVLRLLWTGAWTTDLLQPLSSRSVIALRTGSSL